jgi:4-hydroxybenzoate polyprenyltransferase
MIFLALVRLVRLPNLIIVALTQYLLYYFILFKHFEAFGIPVRMGFFHFSLLVLVTVLLTASGYVINDIMDQEADQINKPEKMVISRYIRRRTGLWMYFCLQAIGFFLAVYLSFYINNLRLLALYPTAAVGLYLYSSHLKRIPFKGHLLIALYCAGVALVVWLAELPAYLQLRERAPELSRLISYIIIAYAIFAFLTTLLRELIKVMEDEAGDRQAGYLTTVIDWGQTKVKGFCILLGVVLLVLLGICALYFGRHFNSWKTNLIAFVLAVPTLLILYNLSRISRQTNFKQLSRLTKLLMLLGVLVLLSFVF